MGWRELEQAERELKALRDEYIVIVSSGREDLTLKERVLAAEEVIGGVDRSCGEKRVAEN
jgi:hypothetical protein